MIAALFISAIATGQDTTSTAGEIVQTKSGPVKVERLATLSEPWGMTFLPDGKLFITSGDRQRFDPAQDMSTNLGKIVRINPDG
ncbi:MAG: PQQ-dependent sugar dehydrogenase, partial [Niastella sp.]|nr:PQQ-dependent sugar dehydrogenase [Niastella sp.]